MYIIIPRKTLLKVQNDILMHLEKSNTVISAAFDTIDQEIPVWTIYMPSWFFRITRSSMVHVTYFSPGDILLTL